MSVRSCALVLTLLGSALLGSALVACESSSTDGFGDGDGGGDPTGGTASGGAPTGDGGVAVGGAAVGGTSLGGAGDGGTAAGGAPVGGSAGTPTSFGFSSAATTVAAATAQYAAWKGTYVEACPDGSSRVKDGGQTFSEGIGYGMILAVNFNDQELFDRLWKYYQGRLNARGLMDWKINGCGTERWGFNAASDADLDAAMALVSATCKWGSSYRPQASALIGKIEQYETFTDNGMLLLKSGDDPAWAGAKDLNPSYFSPAYYRVFAKFVPEKAAFWGNLTTDTYKMLTILQTKFKQPGLVPDWSDSYGNGGPSNHSGGNQYHYDAARTPWRLATDYVWFGAPEAKASLEKFVSWADANGGPGNLPFDKNSVFDGGFAMAAIAVSQEKTDAYTSAWLTVQDSAYFQATLRTIYMMLAARMQDQGCN